MDDQDIQKKRLLYRATHRGTKEADAIVGGFVTAKIDDLTGAERDALETLLDQADPDIMDWLQGRQPMPDDATLPILSLVKNYQKHLLTD